MFQLGNFVPESFAHFLYNTIMGVAKWDRDLWWLSLLCENVKWERVWPFLIELPPWMSCNSSCRFITCWLIYRMVVLLWNTCLPHGRWLQSQSKIHICGSVQTQGRFLESGKWGEIMIVDCVRFWRSLFGDGYWKYNSTYIVSGFQPLFKGTAAIQPSESLILNDIRSLNVIMHDKSSPQSEASD